MTKLFANSEDPDHRPQNMVSDLGLHYLPITLLGVSRLQWVKVPSKTAADDILKYFFFLIFRESKA